ncbi:MAG TPA: bifunctional adenosylcobinamide kinase/adenosylcobinamide-phosphate guanylyltransferase [Pseudonocardia sp.]|jgi:adenosyl cobinamide kinase/adenosyl cobinamide phosphate guanylyltransferase|uniref:bifunctional adenosylcobinamide kinase/adenosylcobinamide-phosphate guanylyltransferase n=1 Tax=Pseudonocardia sp. TaxID=60912 RepID=UPI002B4AC117|nr:bifunctional adenosylcobinamide kinase/adenosylcobinamide-phosphate guanylyltransferase [Pseudonocardia sp.]HLU59606.1 bifunctional adenosylcobinamide kinase/adenosylcobinamide-phosphate guanylyltransferase [Pseudonocardia sp.]
MPTRTLVLGGTRSGKSRHAEDLLPADEPVRYVATARARADDPEWSARIDAHRARRPAAWSTLEGVDVAAVVRAGGGPLLVDDLATWLTGVLDDAGAWEAPSVPPAVGAAVDELVTAIERAPGRVVLVSAEVGLGVVPATRAGRLFRDELGALNAALAAVCDEVVLLVAGLPLRLK